MMNIVDPAVLNVRPCPPTYRSTSHTNPSSLSRKCSPNPLPLHPPTAAPRATAVPLQLPTPTPTRTTVARHLSPTLLPLSNSSSSSKVLRKGTGITRSLLRRATAALLRRCRSSSSNHRLSSRRSRRTKLPCVPLWLVRREDGKTDLSLSSACAVDRAGSFDDAGAD